MNICYYHPVNILKKLSVLAGFLFPLFIILLANEVKAQQTSFDLNKLTAEGHLIADNRRVTLLNEEKGLRVSEAAGSGIVWLKNVNFSNGIIEVDVRGKDKKQGSFLGIAFHGTKIDKTEAIYLRPFNFLATDSAQRMHMVQYVFDSAYGWDRLRNEHPGVYENQITPPPNPNDWVHMKIVIKGKSIKVYVNHSEKACLEVESLNQGTEGKLGLWVGNSSGGDFSNLVVENH